MFRNLMKESLFWHFLQLIPLGWHQKFSHNIMDVAWGTAKICRLYHLVVIARTLTGKHHLIYSCMVSLGTEYHNKELSHALLEWASVARQLLESWDRICKMKACLPWYRTFKQSMPLWTFHSLLFIKVHLDQLQTDL